MAFPSFNLKNTRPKSIAGREGMLREVWRTKQGGREAYGLALELLTVCVNRLVQFPCAQSLACFLPTFGANSLASYEMVCSP